MKQLIFPLHHRLVLALIILFLTGFFSAEQLFAGDAIAGIRARRAAAARQTLTSPVPLSPGEASIESKKRVKLTWSAPAGAKKYQVMVIGGDRKVKSKWVQARSLRFKIPKKNEAYSWKVRCRSGKKKSNWSTSKVFFVKTECVTSVTPGLLRFSDMKESSYVEVRTLNNKDCTWKVSTSASWISGGVYQSSGSRSVKIKVYPNFSKTERRGTVSIGEKTVTIVQDGEGLSGKWDFFFKFSTSSSNTKALLTIFGANNSTVCYLGSIPGASYYFNYSGKWIQSGDTSVKFEFGSQGPSGWVDAIYRGTIASSFDYMSGTLWNSQGKTGTWYAIRQGTTLVK